jgi:hypothetical protein
MTEAGNLIDYLVRWDGSEQAAADWVRPRAHMIHAEAAQDPTMGATPRLVGQCLDTLAGQLSRRRPIAAIRAKSDLSVSPRECAVIAFQTLWSFLGCGARRIGDYQLWDDLMALFSRYAPKLMEIASALRATGYGLAVSVPLGPGHGLELAAIRA